MNNLRQRYRIWVKFFSSSLFFQLLNEIMTLVIPETRKPGMQCNIVSLKPGNQGCNVTLYPWFRTFLRIFNQKSASLKLPKTWINFYYKMKKAPFKNKYKIYFKVIITWKKTYFLSEFKIKFYLKVEKITYIFNYVMQEGSNKYSRAYYIALASLFCIHVMKR